MGLDIYIYRVTNGTFKDFYEKFENKMNFYEKEEKILKKCFNNFVNDNKEKIDKLIDELKDILDNNLNEERLKHKLFTITIECQKNNCDAKEKKDTIKWNVFNCFGILKNIFSEITEEKKDEIIKKIIETTKEFVIREEEKKALDELEKEEKKIGDYNDMLEEVAYFRKYNHLVEWVDENVQEVENGDYIKITREQLQQLLEDAKKALQAYKEGDLDKVDEIMPTTSGFFFGDTEYNDYYKRKLEDTIEQIQNVLNNYSDKEFVFIADW